MLSPLTSIAAMRVVPRRRALLSPLLLHNENHRLELSGHLQYLDSSHPQGANEGLELQYLVP